MAADAKKFGGWVNTLFVHKGSVPKDRIYRTESRSKTPGKLLRVMKRQGQFNSRRSRLSDEEVEREEKAIRACLQLKRMAAQARWTAARKILASLS